MGGRARRQFWKAKSDRKNNTHVLRLRKPGHGGRYVLRISYARKVIMYPIKKYPNQGL